MNNFIIQIREQSYQNDIFQITIAFHATDGNIEEIPITFPNPYNKKTDQLLEYYFEEYISKPYDDIPIQDAPKTIEDYGITLFNQLFTGEANFYYRTALQQATPANLIFEILGQTPAFQAIYWESLKDPNLANPLAIEGAIFRRKNTKHKRVKAVVNPSSTINLLIVTARPNEDSDVNYRTIQRPLIELIQNAQLKVKAHILRPGTYESFVQHLDDKAKYYHIIHFDLHGALLDYPTYQQLQKNATALTFTNWSFQKRSFQGTYALPVLGAYAAKKAFLFFESTKKGTAIPVEAGQLGSLLENKQVPIVLLNACQSAKQAFSEHETSLGYALIQKGIQLVLAMRYSVSVSAAVIFTKTLYQKLYQNVPIEKAIVYARKELYRQHRRRAAFNRTIHLQDWLLPVVYQNSLPHFQLRAFTPEEELAFVEQYHLPIEIRQDLALGFFGRDLDVLRIEKALLTKNNLLLLQGMGGAGKTTLLKYIAAWWLKTDFIQKVFYFGYELKAFTLADILRLIAQNIYDKQALEGFRLLPEKVQQQRIIDGLNANEYLLILDNAESITGVNLAIKNTLTENQKSDLKYFLKALKGGKSRIIIGSRSPEVWLKTGTFGNNHLTLRGLDEESAKNFADAIIRDLNLPIEYIAKDQYFERLLKLLDGFPLALKAVLTNLKNKTAKTILQELEQGLEGLDTGNIGDKTESIVKCIEYSHSNLSEDAQKILICLDPFENTVNLSLDYISIYFDELKKSKEFKDYPFNKLELILQGAIKNGFIEKYTPNSQLNFMKTQPVFTYFLKGKLLEFDSSFQSKLDDAFIHYYLTISSIFDLPFEKLPVEAHTLRYVYAGLELNNFRKALFLQIKKGESFWSLILPVSEYFDKTQKLSQKLLFLSEVDKKALEYNYIEGANAEDVIGLMDMVASTYRNLSKFKEAIYVYNIIINLIENKENLKVNINLQKFKSSVLQKFGIAYFNLGNISKAKAIFNKALDSFKKYGGDKHNLGRIIVVLGNISSSEGDFEKAEEMYSKGLQIAEEAKDFSSQASIHQNLGNIFLSKKEPLKARECFIKSLQIFQKLREIPQVGQAYINLGVSFADEKQYQKATNYFYEALNIFESINDNNSKAIIFRNLAKILNKQEDFKTSSKYYRKTLQLNLEVFNPNEIFKTLGEILIFAKVTNDVELQNFAINGIEEKIKGNDELLKTFHQIIKLSNSELD